MRITMYPRPFSYEVSPQGLSDYEWKDDILVKLAAAYLWDSKGRYDKAAEFRTEALGAGYPKLIGGMLAAAIKQDTDQPDMDINVDMGNQDIGQYWAQPFVRMAP
jgi:hypothetical protein